MKLTRLLGSGRSVPPYLADFDSSTTLVRATSRSLRGAAFPRLGTLPPALARILPAGNRLPRWVRRRLYRWAGASDGVAPEKLSTVRAERLREWVVDQYPQRGYPAVMVGSPNGAAVHLAALLGIPWLPQTFLVPVRRTLPPDAATADLEWGRARGRTLLDANPDLALHHMHDPNQDRLTVESLAYFRVKLLRLGRAYERFLETVLAPGGVLLVVECRRRWPTTRVGDRHVFQFGGVGGLSPQEYHHGSERVAAFLERSGAARTRWDPPDPDGTSPEAEWGFEPTLGDDVARFAREHGLGVRRLRFDDPHDLSPVVAAVYREAYAERGLSPTRLLVSSFGLLDPWWTLRTGSVPYWATFNSERDARALEAYLDRVPYDEVYLSLFSNGVESAGQASIDRWRSVLAAARDHGAFVGVDPRAYPLDFSTYVRYHAELPSKVRARHPLPPPLPLDRLDALIADASSGVAVQLLEE